MLLSSLIEANNLEQAVANTPLVVTADTLATEAITLMSNSRGSCNLLESGVENSYLLNDCRASCVLVIKRTKLVGIFTERDVVRLSAEEGKVAGVRIADVMTSDVITLKQSDFTDISVALNIFQRYRIRHLPILDDHGQIAGIVTHESLRQLLRPVDLLRLRIVADVMSIRTVKAETHTSVLNITKLMARENVSSVIIVEERNSLLIPVGIMTERDIVQFQALGLDLRHIQAQIVMSSPLFSLSPTENLWSVLMLMQARRINRVVITGKQGELLGIVTQTTLLQALNPLDIYNLVDNLKQEVSRLEVEKLELLEIRNAELEQEVENRIAELKKQAEKEKLLSGISSRIRKTLDLQETLNAIAIEVRQFLNCDRVIVYKCHNQGHGVIIAENVKPGWLSLLGEAVSDPCFTADWIEKYIHGRIQVVDDIVTDGMTLCHQQLLESLQIRAKILVPIVVADQLWGLMLACENGTPRNWQPQETELLQQLSIHVAIAIQQADLHHRVQLELQERRRAEAALAASEELYRTTLNNISDALFITDNQGKFTFICPNIDILFGYSVAEVMEMGNIEILLGQDLFTPQKLANHVEITNIEREIIDRQGKKHTVLVNVKQVNIGEGTRLYSCRNITERKQVEKALQDSEERLRTIIETSASGLITVDSEANIVFVNPAAARMFGREKEQLVGWQFALPYDYETHRIQEIEILQPSGQRRIVNMQAANIAWEDENAFLMSMADITELKNTEELLRQSEAKYRLLVENLPLGLVVHGMDARIITCNTKACEIFELTIAQMQRKTALDPTWCFLREDETFMSPLEYPINQVIFTLQPLTNYVVGVNCPQSQTLRWLLVNAFPEFNNNGDLQQVVVTFVDISERQAALKERKQAEIELRNSEERFRQIAENLPEVIWMTDNEGSEIIFVSPQYEKIWGLSCESFYQQPYTWMCAIHEDDQEKVSHAFFSQAALGDYDQEYRIVQPDGKLRWIRDRAFPIANDEGKVYRIAGFAEDITQRKQAEEELRQLNEQLEARVEERTRALRESQYLIERITETSPDILYIYDLQERRNIYTNREIARLLGYSSAEIQQMGSKLFLEIAHPEDIPKIKAHHNRFSAANDEDVWEIEYRMRDRQGNWHWFLSHDTVFSRNSENLVTQIIGAALEMTERKQIEAALLQNNAEIARATRLKDEFLANMSHELRTPLNAILGMSESLLDGVFDQFSDRQKQAISTIERSGKHLLELINDILDLSKIEAGKLELQLAPVACSFICNSSLTFVQQQALKKNIQISLEIPPNLPDLIVDERRVRQMLINLLNNAVKFTNPGGNVKLVVQQQERILKDENIEQLINHNQIFKNTEMSLNPGCIQCSTWISFSIIDNGIGIAKEELDKLFQPFMQIDSSLNRQHNGTGLGLALVQRLVELHGGKVTVSSELGQGSCFTTYIPCREKFKDRQNSLFPAPCQVLPNPKWDNSQVLIIGDSIVVAEQIARYLHELNLETTIYTKGEGAVEQAISIKPIFILLDILLPNFSGWEIIKQIKAHPQTKDIPVIVISGVDERDQALSLGALDYLVKPVNRQQIFQTINKILVSESPSQTSTNVINTATLANPVSLPITVTKSPLILLAEDNQANIATISSYLGAKGYRLIIANNGQEAVNLTKEQHPNLILMDIQMPGMDGLEAMALIRANEKFKHIPMIALTALVMAGDQEKCIAAGANEYLSKPVKLKFLVEKIQHLLNQVTGNHQK